MVSENLYRWSSREKKSRKSSDVELNNIIVVSSDKYLGVTLEDTASWPLHMKLRLEKRVNPYEDVGEH